MYYKKELKLKNFKFWAGAKDHKFSNEELTKIENLLNDDYFIECPKETEINDLFWFEQHILCELIWLKLSEYEER